MNVLLPEDWKKKLKPELQSGYFQELLEFVRKEYEENDCFPAPENVFKAFEHSSFQDTKVVIIGQDPYHGYGQAHGLCFSVQAQIKIPPSLVNIFKELESDLNKPIPSTGNLSHWARQGVLMLNATLTVRAGQAGSHQRKGWEKFTDAVIDILSRERENLVFMLWGGPAKKKGSRVDASRHLILESGHPSPLAANKGHWFGNRHFSRCNEYLISVGKKPIDW